MADVYEDLKNDLHRHMDENRDDFKDLRVRIENTRAEAFSRVDGVKEELEMIRRTISQWSGALGLAKWSLGVGIPAILGAIITHVVRHWTS